MKKTKFPKKAFMCATDWFLEPWQHELSFPLLFFTKKALKKERTCWEQCGIVEVELRLKQVISMGEK